MRKPSDRRACVPDELIDALEAVLAQHWSAERSGYHGTGPGPHRRNHIFLKLEVIRHWLDDIEEDGGGS